MIVSFILDETGSMESVKQQTISGFNEYIGILRREKHVDDIRFTMTKFNSDRTVIVHRATKMRDVLEITEKNYVPAALTPLYDAIGNTIQSIGDTDEPVLFVIQTDGQENASVEFTQQMIFDMIEDRKQKGWTFAFLGADMDAYAAGYALNIPKGNILNYDGQNTRGAYEALSSVTANYVASGGVQSSTLFDNGEEEDASLQS